MVGLRNRWWIKLGCVLLVAVAGPATIGQSPGVATLPQGPTERVQPATGGAVVASASAEGMIVTATTDGLGGQMVTVIDSRRNWMAVYGVDAKGQIKLLSSRPLSQDFAVQYNVIEPTPTAISRLTNR
jgi:hypothetical protein